MRHITKLSVFTSIVIAVSPIFSRADVTDSNVRAAAHASNALALDLYKQFGSAEGGNFIFSPYSIESALEMVADGARGTTANEMITTLNISSLPPADLVRSIRDLSRQIRSDVNSDGGTEVLVANALWPGQQATIQAAYQARLHEVFNTEPHPPLHFPHSRRQGRNDPVHGSGFTPAVTPPTTSERELRLTTRINTGTVTVIGRFK